MTQGRTLLHSKPGPFCVQHKTILRPWLGPPSVGNMSSGQCQSGKSRGTTEMTLEFLRRKTPYRGLRVIITFSMRCAATKTRRFEARPSARLSTNLFFQRNFGSVSNLTKPILSQLASVEPFRIFHLIILAQI